MIFGGMEQDYVGWLLRNFPSIKGAWDVGGHHGEYSVRLAQSLDAGYYLHIFEPFAPSAEVIRRNISANSLSERAFLHECAVGGHEGTADLLLSSKGSQNHSLQSWVGTSGETVTVPMTTLDTALERYGVPELVKIDIEGGELAAFEGAPKLLAKRATSFFFESEHWNPNREELHTLLRDCGYVLSGFHRGKPVPVDEARMVLARPAP